MNVKEIANHPRLADALVQGIEVHDRKVYELKLVITRVMSLVRRELKEWRLKDSGPRNLAMPDEVGKWTLYVEDDMVNLCYGRYEKGMVNSIFYIGLDDRKCVFCDPSFDQVSMMRADLSEFVREMIMWFPNLQGRLNIYFDAAGA
ncbi:MAG: hypothetical protein V4465_01960 [Patescibacteria group bacterium]